MNQAHYHLVLNHFPTIIPIIGLLVLIGGIIFRSGIIKRSAFLIFIVGTIFTVLAFETGEGAEKVVEHLQGINEQRIHKHEETAEIFTVFSYGLGIISLLGLWFNWRKKSYSNLFAFFTIILSIVILFFGIKVGTTGGEIRHIEIRNENSKDSAQAEKNSASSNLDATMNELMEGNKRYIRQNFNEHHGIKERMLSLSGKQNPKAIIISCSDSRVPPEIVFDQSIGDLFVIRVAGNVTDNAVIGSVEYAVKHLHVNLIIVLGHERCGAVKAATEENLDTDHIEIITGYIKTVLPLARAKGGDYLDTVVCENIKKTISEVKNQIALHNKQLPNTFKNGRLKIVGARYDLDTGEVTILKEN